MYNLEVCRYKDEMIEFLERAGKEDAKVCEEKKDPMETWQEMEDSFIRSCGRTRGMMATYILLMLFMTITNVIGWFICIHFGGAIIRIIFMIINEISMKYH